MRPLIGLSIATWVTAQSAGTALGSISGTIQDDRGRPFAGAVVRLSKLTEYAPEPWRRHTVVESGFSREVPVGPLGTFTVDKLPRGTYQICAYGTLPTDVTGCLWDSSAVVRVGSGQDVTGVVRKIISAKLLTVRVSDPARRIAMPDKVGIVDPAKRFFPGVVLGTRYQPMRLVSAVGSDFVFELLIPKRFAVRLFIDTELSITDESDRPVESKTVSRIEIPASEADAVQVVLKVK